MLGETEKEESEREGERFSPVGAAPAGLMLGPRTRLPSPSKGRE